MHIEEIIILLSLAALCMQLKGKVCMHIRLI